MDFPGYNLLSFTSYTWYFIKRDFLISLGGVYYLVLKLTVIKYIIFFTLSLKIHNFLADISSKGGGGSTSVLEILKRMNMQRFFLKFVSLVKISIYFKYIEIFLSEFFISLADTFFVQDHPFQ